jgi:hypothetical protein
MSLKVIRNWLNLIFIIGAAVGMYLFYTSDRETGTYIILASMIVKFIESGLRMIKST